MHSQLALVIAALVSLPSVTAQPTRYSVSVADYTWVDSDRGRAIPARVYCPDGESGRFPVIVFSTGLGRSRDDCAYLGRHWASCGYVAVHVQHKGSDNDVQRSLRPRKELQRAFYDPHNIRDRPLDLPGQLAFAEPRVRAVVAMSAPVPLGQVPLDLAYGGVSLPCLYVTGTADNSLVATTKAPQRRLPFDHVTGADQYLLTFYGADHLMYSRTDARDTTFQRLIAECSRVFWEAYLKDDARAKAWLAEEGINAYVGAAGWVEKKLFRGDAQARTAIR